MACNNPNCVACRLRERMESKIMNEPSNKDNVKDLAVELAAVVSKHKNDFNVTLADCGVALTLVLEAHSEYMANVMLLDNIDIIVSGALRRSQERGRKSSIGEA